MMVSCGIAVNLQRIRTWTRGARICIKYSLMLITVQQLWRSNIVTIKKKMLTTPAADLHSHHQVSTSISTEKCLLVSKRFPHHNHVVFFLWISMQGMRSILQNFHRSSRKWNVWIQVI